MGLGISCCLSGPGSCVGEGIEVGGCSFQQQGKVRAVMRVSEQVGPVGAMETLEWRVPSPVVPEAVCGWECGAGSWRWD